MSGAVAGKVTPARGAKGATRAGEDYWDWARPGAFRPARVFLGTFRPSPTSVRTKYTSVGEIFAFLRNLSFTFCPIHERSGFSGSTPKRRPRKSVSTPGHSIMTST